jgi:signal transduction histidine kinase
MPPSTEASPIEADAKSAISGLRLRVLLPLCLGILLALTVGAAVLVLAQLHHEEHDSELADHSLRVMLDERTAHDVQTMKSLMLLVMDDRRLQQLFLAGDRDALAAATAPLMQGLLARNGISHLYFIRGDRSVMLRAHRPGEFDDRIDRYTLQQAQASGTFHSGYEQGPYGSYTLRVTTPWVVDGRTIGFVEMGVEFEQLIAGIRKALHADVVVVINKSLVNHAKWQTAQGGNARKAPWDEYPGVVVLSRTLDAIPAPVKAYLAKGGGRPAENRFRFREDGRVAQVIARPLNNMRGMVVGEMVMIKDVTEIANDSAVSLAIILGCCITIAAALALFINVVLGRVQKDMAARTARLAETRRVLAHEQVERHRAEVELGLQQERNELLEGRARMAEALSEANRKAEEALQENEKVTGRLREAQSELLATARAAGRAEIATNVLHNVGNVLNSVNVSAGVIGSTLRNSRVTGLSRAVQLLSANAGNLGHYLAADEKGRMLPGYLAAVSETLSTERDDMLGEVDRLIKSVDHIKDIVATQQSHASAANVIEPVNPSELAEDALRMQGTALARHQIAVVREYDEVPPVPLDRGRVLQILVNLISNAKAAMAGSAITEHRVTLRVGLAGSDRLRFSVTDVGEGIAAENLTRIFAHGFTTRKDGHGFGLHSSALAARQMGGTLSAHSDGPGRGATFTLELPLVLAPAVEGAGATTTA